MRSTSLDNLSTSLASDDTRQDCRLRSLLLISLPCGDGDVIRGNLCSLGEDIPRHLVFTCFIIMRHEPDVNIGIICLSIKKGSIVCVCAVGGKMVPSFECRHFKLSRVIKTCNYRNERNGVAIENGWKEVSSNSNIFGLRVSAPTNSHPKIIHVCQHSPSPRVAV